ncbi:MinD-like ATPase involved in chromosome partitioning or flagellar assembly [Actinokineospora alba]|uniref:MinD-like ATPase involved in chromosome partitioning or flagellar assembly n=1 Tax=Actinokineospora alba TaxID=504798 RepID=A0A1H0LC28_9PSEU|nr:chromosome partitioning protein [Actinokineospora alba]TDP67273.1 MinD-like ATPase involved in chromosome partitioning or flagellar assembly [Actinokineospora alba]SDJ01970.1 MinD-like ATPase involved in chromosome partitioning or flagellar assembly [Actinokineospora alba]SDO65799.1 MinD-like ATPase involved in chromosome partitioning or flagellar assembly [Actinokineospora alba]
MLIAVVSVKGSPGVTTFCTALAARWPDPVRTALVEADPSGGDIGIRFSMESTPGLVSLAAAARRNEDPDLLWQQAQTLPGGLAVVSAPSDADRARAALSALAEADPPSGASILRTAANTPGSVVIADCGRIDAGSAALPIVRCADVLILLTRAHADDLAHLARRLPVIGRWTPHPEMLLVGEGYSPTDVARELGVRPLGRIPDDPRGAAVLCGRTARTSRWRRGGPTHSALGQVAHKVAEAILARQAPAPVAPGQGRAEDEPVPILRAVPGVPATAVAAGGLRLAPSPQQPHPDAVPGGNGSSSGGQAS